MDNLGPILNTKLPLSIKILNMTGGISNSPANLKVQQLTTLYTLYMKTSGFLPGSGITVDQCFLVTHMYDTLDIDCGQIILGCIFFQ